MNKNIIIQFKNSEINILKNIINNNNNNNNNNYNNKDIFLNRIWRNISIRSEILKHLKLYIKYEYFIIDETIDQLIYHQYRQYITGILFKINSPLEPKGVIPSNVKFIWFDDIFDQKIKYGDIPNEVSFLSIGYFYRHKIDIKQLLPKSIRTLYLHKFDQELLEGDLNQSEITDLTLSLNKQKLNIGVLPLSIIKLNLTKFNNILVQGVFPIPSSLTELYLPKFNQNLFKNVLPSTLKILELDSFNQPIESKDILPQSLIYLKMNQFNHPILPFTFPSNLKELKIDSFNHPLNKDSISFTKLSTLSILSFNYQLNLEYLPFKTLKEIYINVDYSYPISISILEKINIHECYYKN